MSVRAPLKPLPFETADTVELGRFKRARRAYGFDEVALVPGRVTINPEEVDSSVQLGSLRLAVPILAAAMDGVVGVSSVPAQASRRAGLVQEAGADCLVVQGTVLTARHISRSYEQLSFEKLCAGLSIPVVAGNCVEYETALELMQTGIAGILVGVGPGAACTTRGVLGVGVPQVTATSDVAAARETWLRESGRRVQVITDGGMRVGGDIAKAFASGADAVMVGSIFAGTTDAAGGGYHWGMATPDPNLPRGTRIKVGRRGTLREVLLGPARVDDGTQNLVGALRSAMGVCGARDLREFQQTELVIAPAIQNEGKLFQQAQQVGMGT